MLKNNDSASVFKAASQVKVYYKVFEKLKKLGTSELLFYWIYVNNKKTSRYIQIIRQFYIDISLFFYLSI